MYHPVEKVLGKITLENGSLVRICKGNMKLASTDAIIAPVPNTFKRRSLCQSIYKEGIFTTFVIAWVWHDLIYWYFLCQGFFS